MATDKQATWNDWMGADVNGSDGDKIGSLENVYVDADSGRPEWLGVKTGLFGTKETLVPIEGVEGDDGALRVAYTKDQVKDAPNVDPAQGEVDRQDESEIYAHYGLTGSAGSGGQKGSKSDREAGDDASMTRSEEEMKVGTRSKEAGRVRLTKHVVTENVTTTVPVRKEVARIERETISDGEGGGEITEGDQEIVLSQEEVVVDKKVVAKERVHLEKDVETEEREVSGEVRKEEIAVDRDGTSER